MLFELLVLCMHPSKKKKKKSQQEPNTVNISGNHEMTQEFREKGDCGLSVLGKPYEKSIITWKTAKHCLNCIKKEWHSIMPRAFFLPAVVSYWKSFVEMEDIETQCKSER